MIRRLPLFIMAFVFAIAIASSSWTPSWAREPGGEPDIIRELLDGIATNFGHRPTYERIEQAGSDIIIHKLSLLPKEASGGETGSLMVERTLLANPRKDDGGLWLIDRVEASNIEFHATRERNGKTEHLHVTAPKILLTGASMLPRAAARNGMERVNAGELIANSASIPSITIKAHDIPEELHILDLKGSWEGDRRTGMGKGMFDLGKLVLPASLVSKGSGDKTLEELGYEKLTLNLLVKFNGHWDDKKRAHFDLSVRLGALEAGMSELEIVDLALPLALLEELADEKKSDEMAERIVGNPANELKDVTIKGMRISWIDNSLTGRLIPLLARKQGMDPKAYAANISVYPQLLLMQIGLPQLAAQASEEIKKFVAEPRSLSVSFAAKAPMSFATMFTLLSDPAGLADTLGLKIEANTLK